MYVVCSSACLGSAFKLHFLVSYPISLICRVCCV